MSILDRRLLGPLNQFPVSGGGAGSLTIDNNVDGYILKATGDPNKIEGIPQLKWDSTNTTLSASSDVYISGSNNYLYLHGSDADGNTVRFKVQVSGSILRLDGENPQG
tara:strand:- start:222 stop:545 length:324 start_codon:yes stop_codon:yes gene_type:complete